MRNLIVLLFLFNTAFGQIPAGGTLGERVNIDSILNAAKGGIGPTYWPTYTCTVVHLDGICPWEKQAPDKKPYGLGWLKGQTKVVVDGKSVWLDLKYVGLPVGSEYQAYPIWVIWCLKKGNSVVFASPGIHVNGVDLIHWKGNKYKPIPKTRKVITIIK